MAKIKTLKQAGEVVYPRTTAKAVFSSDGKDMEALVEDVKDTTDAAGAEVAALRQQLRMPGDPYDGVDLTVKFATEIAGYANPWEWIKARIKAGNFSKLHVGDYIPVTCTNNSKFNARIGGINTYKGYSDTAIGNHIDFISASLWRPGFKINLVDFNNGYDADHAYPWLCSNGYAFLNSLKMNVPNATGNKPETVEVDYTENGVYNFLPDALKAVIVEKRILLPKRFAESGIQFNDSGTGWANIGKLWLPSEVEVVGMKVWGDTGHGVAGFVQYPLFANNMNRMIDRDYWWTISTYAGSTRHFVDINRYGYAGIGTASDEGRAPVCFRIGG